MFILALISAMKAYCKKNNSHCIPKAPKHDPFHLSFPPLYLGSGALAMLITSDSSVLGKRKEPRSGGSLVSYIFIIKYLINYF